MAGSWQRAEAAGTTSLTPAAAEGLERLPYGPCSAGDSFAIGAAVLFGVPLALFLGIAAAIARARSKRESANDLPATGT